MCVLVRKFRKNWGQMASEEPVFGMKGMRINSPIGCQRIVAVGRYSSVKQKMQMERWVWSEKYLHLTTAKRVFCPEITRRTRRTWKIKCFSFHSGSEAILTLWFWTQAELEKWTTWPKANTFSNLFPSRSLQRPSWTTSQRVVVASVWRWLWRGRTSTVWWRAPPRRGWRWMSTSCRRTPSTTPPTPVSLSPLSSVSSSSPWTRWRRASPPAESALLTFPAKLNFSKHSLWGGRAQR